MYCGYPVGSIPIFQNQSLSPSTTKRNSQMLQSDIALHSQHTTTDSETNRRAVAVNNCTLIYRPISPTTVVFNQSKPGIQRVSGWIPLDAHPVRLKTTIISALPNATTTATLDGPIISSIIYDHYPTHIRVDTARSPTRRSRQSDLYYLSLADDGTGFRALQNRHILRGRQYIPTIGKSSCTDPLISTISTTSNRPN